MFASLPILVDDPCPYYTEDMITRNGEERWAT